MPATVTCPSCHVTLKPKTPLPAGARIKCPKCQTTFTVPADEEAAPAAPAPTPAGPKSGVARPPAPNPAPPHEDVADVAQPADDAPGDAAPTGAASAGAGFKDKLKKVPMWGWIVGGVAVLFLMCGCCGIGSWIVEATMLGGSLLGGGNVSMTTYKQLKKGMTEDEVKKVMGGEPSLQLDLGGVHSETWKGSGDDFITVQFSNKKAIVGGYHFTNGAIREEGGGPLP